MKDFLEQLFSLIIQPPGNLAYHLVIVFALTGALQAVANYARPGKDPKARRMLLGVGLLLVLQAVQFIAAALTLVWSFDSQRVLPVLDRGIYLFSLVILVWMWLVPNSSRMGDLAAALLGTLVVAGMVFISTWWSTQPDGRAFNSSEPDFGTQVFSIVLLGLAILGISARRPAGWAIGLAMFTLLMAGNIVHLVLNQVSGDYSGSLRLAQMAAYPWLFALVQRFPALAGEVEKGPEVANVPERRRHTINPKAVYEFLNIASAEEPEKFIQDIPRGIAHLMLADYCFLILPQDEANQFNIPLVFDLIKEMNQDGFSIEARALPQVASAMQRGKVLRLPSSSASLDMVTLARYMQLGKIGSLMVAPVTTGQEEKVKFGLLLVSPYSNRTWSAEDQAVMENVAAFLGKMLSRRGTMQISVEQDSIKERLDSAQHYSRQMQEENYRLLAQVDILQRQSIQDRARAESLAALIAGQDAAGSDKQPVDARGMVSIEEYQFLEGELRKAVEQVAELQVKLSTSQAAAGGHETGKGGGWDGDKPEEILTLIHELRQPLASISGYTDVLLLDENVATPGSQLRKLLERIKTSVERMTGLADELNHLTTLSESSKRLSPELIDLNDVIDDAIASAMVSLREKNLLLRVDIAEDLPEFLADRSALQKILACLLENAGACTADDGEITLRARAELKEHEPGYILIQICDSGEGIPKDDLPYIFSTVYNQRRKKIPGVGVSPEALVEVKAAVEAHGGRIWVDSQVGQGSTFSALFPLAEEGLGVR